MPGTSKPYVGANVPQGPAEVWFDVALPGAAATVTLHTDGTPESVANPSAKFLGKLDEGVKVSYKPKVTECMSDESTAPYRRILEAEEISISGNWQEIQRTDLLLRMTEGGSLVTGAGFERVTIGGLLTTIPTYVFMLVWLKPDQTTKWVSMILYKALNDTGWDFGITRKKNASSAFSMRALTVDTRAAGDQIAQFNSMV